MALDVNVISGCGTYTLLLFVSKDVTVTVGGFGKHKFPSGYYAYTGSALGKGAACLKNRVARYLKKEKRLFWHIDYLLADQNVSVEAVVMTEISQKMECKTNRHIKSAMAAEVRVKGFGASDCRKNWKSHLLYFRDNENVDWLVQKIFECFMSASGVVSVYVLR